MTYFNTTPQNNQPQVSERSQFYSFTLACGTEVPLQAIEESGLSYIPCNHERPLFRFAHLWESPTQIHLDRFPDAHGWGMKGFQGIQIFTGKPTRRYRDGKTEYLTVIDIEAPFIERFPDRYEKIEQILRRNCDRPPCIVESKGHGRHIYIYVPEYLERKRSFKAASDAKMLGEFLSKKGLARLDDRYRMREGSIFDIPSLPTKKSLQEIYYIIQAVSQAHQPTPDTPKNVERCQLGDLDIHWQGGKSQYFPLSHCPVTQHKDQDAKKVQFFKTTVSDPLTGRSKGAVKGHCYNCGESWWETPPMTPEHRTLATEILGIAADSRWQTKIPQIKDEIPIPKRRIYAENQATRCGECGQVHAIPYIERYRHIAGIFCRFCGNDTEKGSYLQYELARKIPDAIISDFDGYIANDPLLEDQSLWAPGGIFHLGAPMGTGKTTLIYQRAREAAESGALTIIVVPRISLAKAVHSELRTDTALGWTLFYEGSEKRKRRADRWQVGEYGAVCTLGVLPHLLKNIAQQQGDTPIRIFIDEIDFASSLLLADIFKNLSQQIKVPLLAVKHQIGIVTAGQTAVTSALQALAKELDSELRGYYQAPRPAAREAKLYFVKTGEVKPAKNRLVQAVIDHAQNIVDEGKHCYIFCDERRSAQIIENHFGDAALLYDRYHRESPQNNEMLRLKRLPDGKQVLLATTAIDVGVSLEDENAETLVLNVLNPLYTNGLASTVQQCLRNRKKPPLSIYSIIYQNALPLAPTQATHFQTEHARQKLSEGESLPAGLIDQLGIHDALVSLAADQPEPFFRHHLKQAGFETQVMDADWETVDFQYVKTLRKRIKDEENEQIAEMVLEFLCPEQLLTESEIRRRSWEDSQPPPLNQLASEKANALLQAAGWDGELERYVETADGYRFPKSPQEVFENAGVTPEMWEAARNAAIAGIAVEKINDWTKGYLTTHYPDAAFEEFEEAKAYENHHRPDNLFIGSYVKELLEKLPSTPAPMEKVGQALIEAAQAKFGKDRLAALMKNGSISPKIAKQVRFINLDKDAIPTHRHFDFVQRFIETYYPARIAKSGNLYQLASPQDTEQYEAFKQLMQCRVKHKYPDANLEPDNDLMPPSPLVSVPLTTVFDPKAEAKARVREMRENGWSCREIERQTGIPDSTVCRWWSESSRVPHGFSTTAPALENPIVPKVAAAPSRHCAKSSRVPHGFSSRGYNIGNEWGTRKSKNAQAPPGSHALTAPALENPIVPKVASALAPVSVPLTEGVPLGLLGVRLTDVTTVPSRHCAKSSIQQQILELLATGQKTTAMIVKLVEGHASAIKKRLSEMIKDKAIIRVRRGVYTLPDLRQLPTISLHQQILKCLAEKQRRTAQILESVEGSDRTIKRKLEEMVNAGEIVRVGHGVYDLPVREYDHTLGNGFQYPRAQFNCLFLDTGKKISALIRKCFEANNLRYETPQTAEENRLISEETLYYFTAILRD